MADKAPRRRPTILMLDDDEDTLELLGVWLGGLYEAVALSHTDELLQKALDLAPDLIILDVQMPGDNGMRLCRELRGVRELRRVPVLFLTGALTAEDFLDNLDAGGTAFLRKPVRREELLGHVDRLLAQ